MRAQAMESLLIEFEKAVTDLDNQSDDLDLDWPNTERLINLAIKSKILRDRSDRSASVIRELINKEEWHINIIFDMNVSNDRSNYYSYEMYIYIYMMYTFTNTTCSVNQCNRALAHAQYNCCGFSFVVSVTTRAWCNRLMVCVCNDGDFII